MPYIQFTHYQILKITFSTSSLFMYRPQKNVLGIFEYLRPPSIGVPSGNPRVRPWEPLSCRNPLGSTNFSVMNQICVSGPLLNYTIIRYKYNNLGNLYLQGGSSTSSFVYDTRAREAYTRQENQHAYSNSQVALPYTRMYGLV